MISLLIYRVLLLLLLPIIIIFLVVRSKHNKAYRYRLFERLGYFPKPYKTAGIIVHAASVGEVIALKSFIDKLLLNYPELPITITTFTPTGSTQVKKIFGHRVQHAYLPLDIFPCTALFLHRLKPKMIVFMETELWPNLVAQCKNKDIKLVLINGRLSQKSLVSYKKISLLIKPCLNRFNKILCQSQENLEHFLQLGADHSLCVNSGNLKFDISIDAQVMTKKIELSQLLTPNLHTNIDINIDIKAKQSKRSLWLVASTHNGDEAIVLSAFKVLLTQYPELLLVLVPRHPERFEYVANLCIEQGFSLARRSDNTPVNSEQVWLLDSLGELMAAFDLSDIVTMGGSFNEVGGHNPLEPALFNKPVIVGHNMSNFNEIMQQLRQENAIIELSANEPSVQLVNKVSHLLQQPDQQKILGDNAKKVVLQNQGASEKTLEQIIKLLPTAKSKLSGDNA